MDRTQRRIAKDSAFIVVCISIVVLVLATTTGCTPKATYQQGVFAGQASAQLTTHAEKMDSRTQYWQDRAINFERNDAIAKAAEKKALAAMMEDPARAADTAWSVAIEFASQMEALDAVNRVETQARAGDLAFARELARTPVDVADMSARQDAARQQFARETATMAINTGTQILAQYQEYRTRREQEAEARRQAEELRKEMAEREARLAEREAAMEHHVPEAAVPVQPVIPPQPINAPSNTTTDNTGS